MVIAKFSLAGSLKKDDLTPKYMLRVLLTVIDELIWRLKMPMPIETLEEMIREALPGADVRIEDLRGDGDHYAAHVTFDGFKSLSRVKQHQMVYKALKGKMGGELHALALHTKAPD